MIVNFGPELNVGSSTIRLTILPPIFPRLILIIAALEILSALLLYK